MSSPTVSSKVKALLDRVSLPALPASMARLAQLSGDEEATLADFESALSIDPALSAVVLRLANSASFGLSRTVDSVGQAVRMLGSNTILSLSSSAALASVLPKTMPGYELDALSFWSHSISVAVLTEDILTSIGSSARGQGYTAGLLHDIGKLALDSVLAEEGRKLREQIAAEGGESLVAIESQVAGLDHCEVGAGLVARWQLPPALANVALNHHEPDREQEYPHLVNATHIADGLAHLLGFGADIGELLRRMDPDATARLGIADEELEGLAARSLERIGKLTEALSQMSSETRIETKRRLD